jgi:alkylation response protein AidB-like acyl-CoA dehydrogenase
MDFSYSEEQLEIQALAQRILGDKVTEELLRKVEEGGDRFDPGIWAELGKAGLLGISLGEDVGGGGRGVVEECLVLEEVGRTVAPVPVLASMVMGAGIIDRYGTADQRHRWVEPAADGSTILTAALVEPLNPQPTRPTTTATRQGDDWRLDGVKTCVPAATLASAVLVPASTPDGVGVFIVETDAVGLRITPQHTSNRDTEGYLELDGVVVGDDRLLGSTETGAEIIEAAIERATLGLCATQLGITEEALARTATYAKARVQFERAIATFQAVGQRCADAYIDVEGIRLTTLQAEWRLANGLPARTEIEVAKLWAAEGGHRVVHTAVHIHGGMGVATEYPIHRFFIAAKQIEFTLGSATEQRLRIGASLAAEPV